MRNNWVKRLSLRVLLIVCFCTSSAAYAGLNYCYKDSYGRGVGKIPSSCNAGQETQGKAPFFTCYEKCTKGYDSTALGGCMQTCPANTKRDAFGNCVENGALKKYKNVEYTLARNPDKCTIFDGEKCFWNSCNKRHKGKEGCEKYGAAIVAKCKVGFKRALLHCIPDLNCKGYVGKGVDAAGNTFCETKRKPPRPPKPAKCPAGYVNDAGLCYKKCDANSTGVGPVCWASCPVIRGKQWVECGAGCAEDSTACVLNTTDMVVSVLDSAISIASLGTGSGISKLTSEAKKGLTKGIKAAAKQYGKTFTKRLTSGYKGVMGKVAAGQDLAAVMSTQVSVASLAGEIEDIVGQNISQAEIDFKIVQEVMGHASLLDPSGVLGVVAAYVKPVCSVVGEGGSNTSSTRDRPAGAAEVLRNDARGTLDKILQMQIQVNAQELQVLIGQGDHRKMALKSKEIQERQKALMNIKAGKTVGR